MSNAINSVATRNPLQGKGRRECLGSPHRGAAGGIAASIIASITASIAASISASITATMSALQ